MVTKAIIPAAGYATRMLPTTKVIPKPMLSIANKPAIEYFLEKTTKKIFY